MARKLQLTAEQAVFLTTRVFISRATGIFTLLDISDLWKLSPATIHRYQSNTYRESSRQYAREAYVSYKKSLANRACYRCQQSFDTHPRCQDCTILMHDNTDDLCQSCIDTREGRKVYLIDHYTISTLYGNTIK